MRKLRYARSAEQSLKDIFYYIARTSASRFVGEKFIRQLRDKCEKIAALPGMHGRARPELREGIRSLAFKNYVIFFLYRDDCVEIVTILEGHRDVDAHFDETI